VRALYTGLGLGDKIMANQPRGFRLILNVRAAIGRKIIQRHVTTVKPVFREKRV